MKTGFASSIAMTLLLTLHFPIMVFAQNGGNTGGEVLTNEKVITMTKAGLPASIIVNKIRATKTNFNTSTEELFIHPEIPSRVPCLPMEEMSLMAG